jgi:hypothetical protein
VDIKNGNAGGKLGFFNKEQMMVPQADVGNLLDELNSDAHIGKDNLISNPPSGFKKMVLPSLRDRNR